MTASTAPSPSHVTLPAPDPADRSILDFLDRRFPFVGRDVWETRLAGGKITDDRGRPVTGETPYRENLRLRYFREVNEEPAIPFRETIVYQDSRLLVACKPHFLPVTPSGPYVNECLLYRLRAGTGNGDLVPVHRLDRETAGLVMFSRDPATRSAYVGLFKAGQVSKGYEALAELPADPGRGEWTIESRIVPGDRWFLSKTVEGPANAKTLIRLLETRGRCGRYEIRPITGKRHQIRLHMAALGCRIVHDAFYPELQSERKTGFDRPLQLLARTLAFRDPVTGAPREFRSSRRLEWP